MHATNTDQTLWQDDANKLFWLFVNHQGNLIESEIDDQDIQPFAWTGFRNSNNGFVEFGTTQPPITSDKLNVFAFPNPAVDKWINLRTENPSGKISLHVYDISGKLLFKDNYSTLPVDYKDIQLDVSRYSSGVYLVVVESRNQIKRCKFAIQR
jgi:hypothetical protein